MKELLLFSCCLVPFAAVADEAGKPDAKTQTQAEREAPVCLTETGSRIRPPKGQCINAPGRIYGRDDLASTGEADASRALQKLDPNITSGR